MRVALWGTYDTGKPRVRILRDGLLAAGAEVLECHAPVWRGIEDKSQIRGMAAWTALLLRLVRAYGWLLLCYLRLPRHDLVLLGYPGVLDLFVLRVAAWVRGVPIALDWFLSAYDTLVLDRQTVAPGGPLARVIWAIEWLAIRLANHVFLDTAAHARRMEHLFGLPTGTIGSVWVGAETGTFRSAAAPPGARRRREGDRLRVLFYGQFIPLHGVEHIVGAARLLRDAPVEWTLIGRGQEAARIRRLLEEEPLPRLRWLDWVAYEQLSERIAESDVCLGIFGTSEKAASVIPNKVFQAIAAGRPVVTRDAPAIRELVGEAPRCSTLVPAGDARALAEALGRHAMEPHACPGGVCHRTIVEGIDPPSIAQQFMAMLNRIRFAEKARTGDTRQVPRA